MTLTFYSCADPINKLYKSLTEVGSTSYFKPTDGASELQPAFLLDSPIPNNCNYIYWDYTNRYYFIVDCVHNIGRTVLINCYLDPLQSFQSKLQGEVFYFVRGTDEINEMNDQYYPIGAIVPVHHADLQGWNDNLNNGASGRQFVLRTAAGKGQANTIYTITVDEIVHHNQASYKVVADNGSSQGFFLEYQYQSPVPSGQAINTGDLIQFGTKVFIVDNISGFTKTTSTGDEIVYSFDFDLYEDNT